VPTGLHFRQRVKGLNLFVAVTFVEGACSQSIRHSRLQRKLLPQRDLSGNSKFEILNDRIKLRELYIAFSSQIP